MPDGVYGNSQPNEKISRTDVEARTQIGRNVTYFALSVIGILGLGAIIAAILAGGDPPMVKERFSLVKDVLTTLLPVLGTWVGTVLAFYFSKENFVAAAQQTSDLVRQMTPDQKLKATPVVEAMISMTDPATVKIILDRDENRINLKTDILDALLTKSGRNRLPFVDMEGRVKYVIHRSIIDKFIAEQALSGKNKPVDLTLKDLLDSDQYRLLVTAFGTVSRDAKLNAVKTLMDGNPDCSDAFVTEDGTKNGKAIGWITNVILTEKSRA